MASTRRLKSMVLKVHSGKCQDISKFCSQVRSPSELSKIFSSMVLFFLVISIDKTTKQSLSCQMARHDCRGVYAHCSTIFTFCPQYHLEWWRTSGSGGVVP